MLTAEFGAAFSLLTRLPVGFLLRGQHVHPARAVWAYPLAGAAVGGIGAGVDWLCVRLGLPGPIAAIWTVAAVCLVTGALHEDGLADTADGFGGGSTRARKLEIMRDSRIGSYGALALVLSTGLRVTALGLLATPDRIAPALIAAGALSRGAAALPLLLLGPARAEGLAAPFGERAGGPAWLGLGLAVAAAFAALPPADAVACGAASLAASLAVVWLARRQVGGYTGDTLGAGILAVECVVLSALAAG